MELLVDASAILAVVLNEPEKPAIIKATGDFKLFAPQIISFEVGNALSRLRKRHLLNANELLKCYDVFKLLNLPCLEVNVKQALVISNKYNIYAYDAYYLEVALRRHLTLLSLDNGMKFCAKDMGIKLVEVCDDGV